MRQVCRARDGHSAGAKRRRAVLEQLRGLDQAVFEAVARSDSQALDLLMPALSRAADYSRLWIGIGIALRAGRSRRLSRASTRGLLTLGVTSLLTNQVAKRLGRRHRPDPQPVPVLRRSRRLPTSSSFPSGHSASAAAFAVAVGLESPAVGFGLGTLAGLVGLSRVATGAHYPSDVAAGFALGAGIAVLGGRIVPQLAPPPPTRGEPLRAEVPALADGAGLVVVVNPRSGSGRGGRVLADLRAALPAAQIRELTENDDVATVLDSAAAGCRALGIAGGDGTVTAAAAAAIRHGVPLAVFPAGTFNHFAGDLQLTSVADVAGAVTAGEGTRVDVAYLNDRPFLNTASAGAYPRFVQVREKLEGRIGKPLAAAVAAGRVLRTERPLRARYDGRTIRLNMMFIGNSRYEPRGFAPTLRTRMDDGLLDVRMLESSGRLAGLRLVSALLTGRLARCRAYHELDVPEFELRLLDGPARVARDGEVGELTDLIRVRVAYRELTVYCPRRRPD